MALCTNTDNSHRTLDNRVRIPRYWARITSLLCPSSLRRTCSARLWPPSAPLSDRATKNHSARLEITVDLWAPGLTKVRTYRSDLVGSLHPHNCQRIKEISTSAMGLSARRRFWIKALKRCLIIQVPTRAILMHLMPNNNHAKQPLPWANVTDLSLVETNPFDLKQTNKHKTNMNE